jgi:hypothetical protein
LELNPSQNNPVRITLVYPADATPGHLLSVVPSSQLARVQEQLRQLALAQSRSSRPSRKPNQPPLPTLGPDPIATANPLLMGTGLELGARAMPAAERESGNGSRQDLSPMATGTIATAPRTLSIQPAALAPAQPSLQPPTDRAAGPAIKPRTKPALAKAPAKPKPLVAKQPAIPAGTGSQALLDRLVLQALPPLPPAPGPVEWPGPGPVVISPARMSQSLMDRYQQALENQQLVIKSLGGR